MSSLTLRKALAGLTTIAALVLPAPAMSSPSSFKITIPRIDLTAPLSYTSRNLGPQVYYQDLNTLMIAGHRVTHTHPFYYIERIRVGDPIFVVYNGHRNKYIVKRKAIYSPDQAKHLSWYPGLVLSACTPRHFATYRYVVFARPAK